MLLFIQCVRSFCFWFFDCYCCYYSGLKFNLTQTSCCCFLFFSILFIWIVSTLKNEIWIKSWKQLLFYLTQYKDRINIENLKWKIPKKEIQMNSDENEKQNINIRIVQQEQEITRTTNNNREKVKEKRTNKWNPKKKFQ